PKLDLVRVAENGRRERAAEVGIDAAPTPLAIGRSESLQADVDGAAQAAARLDGVERRAGMRRARSDEGQRKRGEQCANHGHFTCRYPCRPSLRSDRTRPGAVPDPIMALGFSRFRTDSTSPVAAGRRPELCQW